MEKIKNKFKEINESFYYDLIEKIDKIIIKKGKEMIKNKNFTNLEIFEFIKKNENNQEFNSEIDCLLEEIGKNINIKEFKENAKLIEYNKYFLDKIKLTNDSFLYIQKILDQINNFKDFSDFFKYIYQIKEIQNKPNSYDNKEFLIHATIINHFLKLLGKYQNNENSNLTEVSQKIILSSTEKGDDFNELKKMTHIFFDNDIFFDFLIEAFVNPDIKKYINDKDKNEYTETIIDSFYISSMTEKKINLLLKINSLEIRDYTFEK